MAIATINPATEEVLARFDPLSDAELEEKLGRAADAFRCLRYTSFAERARILLRVAALLEAEQEQLSRLITTEMGKPIRSAMREIEKSRKLCCYYAREAERLLADEETFSDAQRSYIRCEPLGV